MTGIAATLALLVAGFTALVYFGQTRLIFFPQPLRTPPPVPANVEEVRLTAQDGTRLHGWLAHAGSVHAPLLIYFGGNAEEVSWLLGERQRFGDAALLLMNYRGYGLSEGAPGERVLLADALQVYDYAAARADLARRPVFVMGRSLGSGVAAHVAARRPVRGVVLVSPYDSLTALAARHYPLLPSRWLLRHRFESAALAAHIRAPLLCLVAQHDTIVPTSHSRALFGAWGGPRRWLEIPAADHVTISDVEAYWAAIRDFITAPSETTE